MEKKKQYLAKVMNNWTYVGRTKNIALQSLSGKEDKEKEKNSNCNCREIKEKEKRKIKISRKTQLNESKILNEIENGRNRVKKDNRYLKTIFTVGLLKKIILEINLKK